MKEVKYIKDTDKESVNLKSTDVLSNKNALPDKDVLTSDDIDNGVKTYEETNKQHYALETPEGKNNGAIPAAFSGQRSNHP